MKRAEVQHVTLVCGDVTLTAEYVRSGGGTRVKATTVDRLPGCETILETTLGPRRARFLAVCLVRLADLMDESKGVA